METASWREFTAAEIHRRKAVFWMVFTIDAFEVSQMNGVRPTSSELNFPGTRRAISSGAQPEWLSILRTLTLSRRAHVPHQHQQIVGDYVSKLYFTLDDI
jgi:hypothetical protein